MRIMAVKNHGQITPSNMLCVFLVNYPQTHSPSSPVENLNNLNCLGVGRRFPLLTLGKVSLLSIFWHI